MVQREGESYTVRSKDEEEAAAKEEEQPRHHLRFLLLLAVRNRERAAKLAAGE